MIEDAITCEDILSEKICATLKEAAKKLKVIVDMATNLKCEDVLKAEWCDKIKEVAAAMKIKFETVMKVMKEIIAKGITKAKEIIEEIKKHFFPSGELMIEDAITCEDILSEKVCATLKEAAKKLKVKVEMVDKI